MSHWERAGRCNNWYTPKFIFDALDVDFDLDVAGDRCPAYCVPAAAMIERNSLESDWHGFIWMNPPFGGRNALFPWLEKFLKHGNGIALTPDRTSAPWFQHYGRDADRLMFIPKVQFLRADGSAGKSPSNGTTLWASGRKAMSALEIARRNGLGLVTAPLVDPNV